MRLFGLTPRGLDFGDCHKSIFAHADSVMGIAFVPNTHYFW